MQEPANAPRLVTCHELAMKQLSTVYQFHNICRRRRGWVSLPRARGARWEAAMGERRLTEILQLLLPMLMLLEAAELVAAAAAEVAVAVIEEEEDIPDISMVADWLVARKWGDTVGSRSKATNSSLLALSNLCVAVHGLAVEAGSTG